MSVASLTNRTNYSGTGTVGPFPFLFRVQSASDLLVIRRSVTGVESTLVKDSQYTIAGVGAASGSVTLITALAVGEELALIRSPALTQPISIRNQGTYFPATIEDEFDRLIMQMQAINDAADRAVHMSPSYDPGDYSPEIAPGADDEVLAWSAGELVNRSLPNGVVLDAVYNILDYGGVGTGLADDSVAINALAALIPAAGGTILFPPGTYKLSTNTVFPKNVAAWVLAGAVFSIDAAKSISINGPFSAGLIKCFSGSGLVYFGTNQDIINAEWWTTNTVTGVTDMSSAINAAIASVPERSGVTIPIRAYAIGSMVILDRRPVNLQGVGWGMPANGGWGSYLKWTGPASYAAGAFVVGQTYQILTVGTTNFMLIGAASNTVGLAFVATGVGVGTGTAKQAMVQVKDCMGAHLDNFRCIGNSLAKPAAAIWHFDSNIGQPNDFNSYSRLWLGKAPWDVIDYDEQLDVGVLIDGKGVGNDSNRWDMVVIFGTQIGVHITGSQYLIQNFSNLYVWYASVAGVKTKANLCGQNWFFAINAIDIYTYDGSELPVIDIQSFGSEAAGRFLYLGAGGTVHIHGGYWQAAESRIHADNRFITQDGNVSHSVILEDFSLTFAAGDAPATPPLIYLKGVGGNEVKNTLKVMGQTVGVDDTNLDMQVNNTVNNSAIIEYETYGGFGANPQKRVRNYLQPDESPDFNRYDLELPVRFVQLPNAMQTIGVGSAPAFNGTWINYDSSIYQGAGFWKDENGVVRLRGHIKDGVALSKIFDLPVGYRPLTHRIFVAYCAAAFGSIMVKSDGSVMHNVGSNVIVSLEGISFEAGF